MTVLDLFNAGFHDGFTRTRRKTNQGHHYLAAYRHGIQARERHENGGEDVQVASARRRKSPQNRKKETA